MLLPYTCFFLRSGNNRLVGASCRISEWIEPNGTLTLTQHVTELAPMRSCEVVAYGYPSPKVVPVP